MGTRDSVLWRGGVSDRSWTRGSVSPPGGFGSLFTKSGRCVFCRIKSRGDGGFKKLEVRVMPAGNTAGNSLLAGRVGCGPVEREMGSVCLYPLDNLGRAWEQAGSPPDSVPPSPPPSMLAGIFQRSSREGAKFRKSLVLISWKSQPMDFFFTLLPFLLAARICKVLGRSLHPWLPCHPTPLPRNRNSPRKSP